MVDIVDVVSRYVTLSKTGQNYRGLCPFHSEKTPSFSVNPTRQMYYCFGCGTGGDVFSFLMNRERFTFVEAVTELAHQAGVDLPKVSSAHGSRTDGDQRKSLQHLHALANAWFQRNLHDSTQGRRTLTYLYNRGVTLDILKEFGVGYALPSWDALTQHLLHHGAKHTELVKAGLSVPRESRGSEREKRQGVYDRFRSRVMVPIMDLRGNVIAFGGRVLEEEGMPKYLNSPETALFNKRQCLFGLDRAREAAGQQDTLLVVEGYFDVLLLHQFGIRHAVAPLGTALTAEHVSLIRRFVKNVILMFDGDAAGHRATVRTLDVFLNSGVSVKVVQLPSGEDPDSYVRAHGADRISTLQQQAQPLIEFAVDQRLDGTRHASVEERTRRVDDVLRILAKVSNPIEKEEYLKQIAERLGIRQSLLMRRSPSAVARERAQGSRPSSQGGPSGKSPALSQGSREEYELVTLLVQGTLKPDHLSALRAEDFLVPEYRRLVELSRFHMNEDGHLNVEAFLAEASADQDLASLVAKLTVVEQHFDDCHGYIVGCLHALERKRLKSTLDALIAQLRIAEREQRVEDINHINAKIESLREQKAGLAVSPQG